MIIQPIRDIEKTTNYQTVDGCRATIVSFNGPVDSNGKRLCVGFYEDKDGTVYPEMWTRTGRPIHSCIGVDGTLNKHLKENS